MISIEFLGSMKNIKMFICSHMRAGANRLAKYQIKLSTVSGSSNLTVEPTENALLRTGLSGFLFGTGLVCEPLESRNQKTSPRLAYEILDLSL